MITCNFIDKKQKKCTNLRIDGYDYCHLKSHYSSLTLYTNMLQNYINKFEEDRLNVDVDTIQEVEPDGACLFRSLSRGLFYHLENDLDALHKQFSQSGYFNEEKDDFLKDFLEISECFKTNDFQMETDLEEEIAKGLQSIIYNFIHKNHQINIAKILNQNARDDEVMLLGNLIFICHEMDIDEYLESYQRFAGDDDFVFEEVSSNGKTKRKKVFINDRWGGIPEIAVFSILFNIGVEVYMPQRFNKTSLKATTINKLPKKGSVYLLNVDKINGQETNIKLLLRQYKDFSHYDYIS